MSNAGQSTFMVGVVVYPGALRSAVFGLRELFQAANSIGTKIAGASPVAFDVRLWSDGNASLAAGEEVRAMAEGLEGHEDVVMVPPSLSGPDRYRPSATECAWLRRRAAAGALMTSACSGAFLLGAAGLLDGRRCTTHWHLAAALREQFPTARVEDSEALVEDGPLLTAGGITAWMDLGLELTRRLAGAPVALGLGRLYLLNTGRRDQRPYRRFEPRFDHGDGAVRRAQDWITRHLGEALDLATLAEVAAMSVRTFQRRFEASTGYGPTVYLQRARIDRATDLLVTTRDSVEQIHWAVGYEDGSAFRKLFRRETGLTPGAFRRRFQFSLSA